MTQVLIDGLQHPVLLLLLTLLLEVACALHVLEIAVNHIPDLVDTQLKITAVGEHLGYPTARCGREQVEGVLELRGGQVGTLYVVTVSLVDHNAVGHLHNTSLYALKLIAGAGQLDKQKEVHHGMHGGLALAHTHGLNKYVIVAGGLAQHYRLTRLARHTA